MVNPIAIATDGYVCLGDVTVVRSSISGLEVELVTLAATIPGPLTAEVNPLIDCE